MPGPTPDVQHIDEIIVNRYYPPSEKHLSIHHECFFAGNADGTRKRQIPNGKGTSFAWNRSDAHFSDGVNKEINTLPHVTFFFSVFDHLEFYQFTRLEMRSFSKGSGAELLQAKNVSSTHYFRFDFILPKREKGLIFFN